jgi:hypothetical protein
VQWFWPPPRLDAPQEKGGKVFKRHLKDPHLFLFKVGFAIVLAIELYKFIKFIAS